MTNYDYNGYSSVKLCKYHSKEFDVWWNPDKFDWGASWALCKYIPDRFNIWWNPERFNWFGFGSRFLCQHLPKFNTWWDPTKFDWESGCGSLCKFLSDKFDTWWDPQKFNWEKNSAALLEYIVSKIDVWFDPFLYGWNMWKFELKRTFRKEYELYRYLSKVNSKEFTFFIKDQFSIIGEQIHDRL
ncbi:MAG: hypothetical protein QXP04_03710 [Candidatus Nanoarchaeia archaeon]|nr:hypothetical protein [Candidatus Jingweiarchaeum tengchongense]